MKLHMANSKDGYTLWGAFLDGNRNDGDGGIRIHQAWFMVARNKAEVIKALGKTIKRTADSYTAWYSPPKITYRAIAPAELTVCYRRPGGRLEPIELDEHSAEAFTITAALMDTR